MQLVHRQAAAALAINIWYALEGQGVYDDGATIRQFLPVVEVEQVAQVTNNNMNPYESNIKSIINNRQTPCINLPI